MGIHLGPGSRSQFLCHLGTHPGLLTGARWRDFRRASWPEVDSKVIQSKRRPIPRDAPSQETPHLRSWWRSAPRRLPLLEPFHRPQRRVERDEIDRPIPATRNRAA